MFERNKRFCEISSVCGLNNNFAVNCHFSHSVDCMCLQQIDGLRCFVNEYEYLSSNCVQYSVKSNPATE